MGRGRTSVGQAGWLLLPAVRANVLRELRVVAGPGAPGPEALLSLALGLDRLVVGAAALAPGRVAGPRLLAVRVAPARAGAAAAVTPELGPGADPAAHVVFECSWRPGPAPCT